MEQRTRKLVMGFIVFSVIASSVGIILYVKTAPFFYVGLLGFLLCLFLSLKLKKALFFNLAVLLLLGGLTDAYFTWFMHTPIRGESHTKEEPLQGGDYFVADTVRGYAAGASVKKRVKKTIKEKVVYDVIYTTNQTGLRVTPHDLENSSEEQNKDHVNAVFFGDSFTFGEGLNDDESLPYLFEELSGGRYRAYNFAFHGYGPHQMLRTIETGLMAKIVSDQQPLVVVYEALLQHIERVAGKLIWDAKVPRYRLSSSGMAEYAGTFVDDPALKKNLAYSKSLSTLQGQLLAKAGMARLIGEDRTPEDIRLYVQVVLQAKDLIEKKYQGKFYVVLWPLGDKDAAKVMETLKSNGVEIITVDQVFKKYPDPPETYVIANDHHPTKLANERLARYLLDYLH